MKSKEQIKIPDHTGKRETRLLAFVWNCGFFSRDVSDEKIIEMWRKSPARSLDDPEDETFYDVECLTPDELAGRINDESFRAYGGLRTFHQCQSRPFVPG